MAIAILFTVACAMCSGPTAKQSVVLIVLDTIRADRVGDLTPNLDRFAESSVVFTRAVAASPWTSPSVVAMTTGSYADEFGIRKLEHPLPPDATTLAELLQDRGWRTGAVVSNLYVSPAFGHGQGYDDFWAERYQVGEPIDEGPVSMADHITDVALDWIAQQSEPYYLYVHYTDPHTPYWPPRAWRARFVDDPDSVDHDLMYREGALSRDQLTHGDVDLMKSMYDASVAFMDQEMGRLLDQLPEDVLVAIVGDHGEEFLDHGQLYHGHTVYEELIHVPLIVRGPRFDPGVSAEVVSHVDMTPTILDVLDVPIPPGLSGQSFRRALSGKPLRAREPALAVREFGDLKEVSARQDNWKLIYANSKSHALFDLGSDPTEQKNVVHEHADLVAKLEASVVRHLDRSREIDEVHDEESLEERMETLRSLGYVN